MGQLHKLLQAQLTPRLHYNSMSQTVFRMVPVTYSAGNMINRTAARTYYEMPNSNMESDQNRIGGNPCRNEQNMHLDQTEKWQGQNQCRFQIREMMDSADEKGR